MVTENPFNEALSENQDKGQLSLFVNYNPDVLNCLANLSSDEVFPPPRKANPKEHQDYAHKTLLHHTELLRFYENLFQF
ncbi:Uncharacterised protein [Moraxella ovis]|nr:Uncharacterised protein [Moraxella ovis]